MVLAQKIKMQIKNLVLLKGFSSHRLLHEFPQKWNKNGLGVLQCQRSEAVVNFCLCCWVKAERHRQGHWSVAVKAEGMCSCTLNNSFIEITVCLLNGFVFTTVFHANIEYKGKHSHRSISINQKQLL